MRVRAVIVAGVTTAGGGWLVDAIDTLPAAERDAIDLIYRARMSHRRAASLLGLTQEKFSATLARAMRVIASAAAQPLP